MKIKKSGFPEMFFYTATAIFSISCIIPMIMVAVVSVTDEQMIIKHGYTLIPKKISFSAYNLLFGGTGTVLNSYLISTIVTVAGTAAAVIITAMAAYVLSNNRIKNRNLLAMYFFFTMLFSGGIVPWYIITTRIGLSDSILSLIIPSLLFSPFNMFLVRNFMQGIPESLMESARIDGANDIYIAFRIYMPLSVPALATIALFYGIAYWNDWWNTLMLVNNKSYRNRCKKPVQVIIAAIPSQSA